MSGVLFGQQAWDPVAITAQIVALQCLYYLSLGVLYKMVVAPYVPGLTLYHFFDWRWASFSSFQGWMVSVANFTNALIAAFYLRLVVQRAKKCLDFAGTILLLHFLCVTCFSGFPRNVAWWVLHGSNLAVTALLGEWLCMQKEMQEIPLTSLRRGRTSAAASATAGRAMPGAQSQAAAAAGPRLSVIVDGGGADGSSGSQQPHSQLHTVRQSAANVVELGRMQSQDRQHTKDWAPLSPVDSTPLR